MRFLSAVIDALVGFVQRNPLFVLVILILALGAPAVLKGIAVFFLYLILGIVALVVVLMLLFRWKITSLRRQMEEQQRQGGFGSPFAEQQQAGREGEVQVHKTPEAPEKRVSKDVGDYVEFEETKDENHV